MKYLKKINFKKYSSAIFVLFIFIFGCNYVTYKSVLKEQGEGEDDFEPNYDVTLDDDYQNFVTFFYMGNRSEMFGTFFNKFYQSLQEYDEALTDYRATTISAYNRRLDSLNITPPISSAAKEKLNNVLSRCSKIIQYNKSTRFMDDAVLLIGKSYFYQGEYISAERKFNEFLSKLTKSNLHDEAILYLGKSKLKLGKTQEAEILLSNLFKTTPDNEIKSEITQDLAILAISKNDFQGAIDNFRNSIELTKDKEKKAEKQYILAKIYSRFKPTEAYSEYKKANDLTSDFDLLFYSKLNEAKSLVVIGQVQKALEILEKQNSKYRDYPEMKQLVELEIGNTLYTEKKYKEAREKYYNVILTYPSTKAAADSYYHLADYSENAKKDYLHAYINYKKVSETNSQSDFVNFSTKKATTLDKYFTLVSVIKDTVKITYPENEPEFEKFKEIWNKEKGIDEKEKGKIENNNNPPPKPKGSGQASGYLLDSIGNIEEEVILNTHIDSLSEIKKEIKDSVINLKADTTENKIEPEVKKDTTEKKTEPEVKKLSPQDSLLLAMHIEDSIKVAKLSIKVDAYFQLSELFLYELGRTDSAIYYLDRIISDSLIPEKTSKALYSVATIYKNLGNEEKANEYFKRVISQYPYTSFANEARKILGIQIVEIEVDSLQVLFKSAEQNILKNNFESALANLRTILYKNRPGDSLYIKSLYSLGWIYEYGYKNKDSSLFYYKRLKLEYPSSAFVQNITPKIEFYTALDKIDSIKKQLKSMGTLSDSLKNIYDSLTYITDSTSWNINLSGTNKIVKTDSSTVSPENKTDGKKETKGKNKQGNEGEAIEETNPKDPKK